MKGFEDLTEAEAIRKFGARTAHNQRARISAPVSAASASEPLLSHPDAFTGGVKKLTKQTKGHKYRAEPCMVSADFTLFTTADFRQLAHAQGRKDQAISQMSLRDRARLCGIEGDWFGSLKEGRRYIELAQLQKAGVIRNLERQVSYYCVVHPDTSIGFWVADFVYEEPFANGWRTVVEDCKGHRTALYKWKKRHIEAQYGIKIRET